MNNVRKLIYIANFRMPTEKAHGYQVAKMCESFAAQSRRFDADNDNRGSNAEKIEVELIIPSRRNGIKQDLFDYYGIERNFKVTQILTPDFIAYTPLFLRQLGFFLQSFFYLCRLYFHAKYLRESASSNPRESAVIYSRNPEIIFLFSRRGYKTIFESHRWPESKIWLHKFFIKKAFKIVTVTGFLKDLYKNAGFKEPDILVAPDGVDMGIFDIKEIGADNQRVSAVMSEEDLRVSARKLLNLPQKAVLLGYTGHLQTMGAEKGFSEILGALREILKKRDDVYFVSVGGGEALPTAQVLQDLAQGDGPSRAIRQLASLKLRRSGQANMRVLAKFGAEASVTDHILMLERVDRKKLALYQKAFDVLLMPFPRTTHYSYYMSPMKMFEYMASRRPIVASDLPSVREVLYDTSADNQRGSASSNNQRESAQYGNAILVEAGNPKALADGINKVLDDSALGQKLAEKAYADVQGYTWEKRATNIIKFIEF